MNSASIVWEPLYRLCPLAVVSALARSSRPHIDDQSVLEHKAVLSHTSSFISNSISRSIKLCQGLGLPIWTSTGSRPNDLKPLTLTEVMAKEAISWGTSTQCHSLLFYLVLLFRFIGLEKVLGAIRSGFEWLWPSAVSLSSCWIAN